MSFAGLIRALNAVKNDTATMENIPNMFWQPHTWGTDFFLELTKFHWTAIYRVPQEAMSLEIVNAAVEQTGLALFHVPMELRSHALCKKALESTLAALGAVPEPLLSDSLDFALNQMGSMPSKWAEVPKDFRTEEFAIRAVGYNPMVMEHIPPADQTQAICEAFLSDWTAWLEDIKEEARSRTLCMVCLRAARGPLKAVPGRFLDTDAKEADRQGQMLLAAEEAESEKQRTSLNPDPPNG